MRQSSSRNAFLVLFTFLWSTLTPMALAGQVNVTVDDSDPSINYQPPAMWWASTNSTACSYCLTPLNSSSAFQSTWHHGLHIIPVTDSDDTPPPPPPPPPPPSSSDNDDDDGDDGDDGDSDSGKGKGKGGKSRREETARVVSTSTRVEDVNTRGEVEYLEDPSSTSSPFDVQKFDADDPQFNDLPVFIELNFTGSAIYLYCLLPLGLPPNSNSTPTLTNLTYTLDGQPSGNFFHDGTASQSGQMMPNSTVFSMTGLSQSPHTLRVDIGPDSVMLFDYFVVTQSDGNDAGSSIGAPSTATQPTPSPSEPTEARAASSKPKNVATFGGAVGGSVGVLCVIAICLAASLIRRRQRAAKRDRQRRARASYASSDAESYHSGSGGNTLPDEGPQMQGPSGFVPRYFPGTVPAPPPPYAAAEPRPFSPSETTPLSYDDISPHLDGDEPYEDVPPSFVVAIASPEPPLLANIIRRNIVRNLTSTEELGQQETEEGALPRQDEQETGEMQILPPPLTPLPRSRPPSFRTTEGSLAPRPNQPDPLDNENILETAGDEEEYDINGNIILRR